MLFIVLPLTTANVAPRTTMCPSNAYTLNCLYLIDSFYDYCSDRLANLERSKQQLQSKGKPRMFIIGTECEPLERTGTAKRIEKFPSCGFFLKRKP